MKPVLVSESRLLHNFFNHCARLPMKLTGLLILLNSVLLVSEVRAEQLQIELEHQGLARSLQLYIPDSLESKEGVALVVALHGRTSNGQRMAELSELNARADENGFIVAYPDGIDNKWNYLHGIWGYQETPNDSDFILAIIEGIKQRYPIDSSRVFATGISNGGFMVQRLACYAPQVFAGFASVAASGYAHMMETCPPSPSVNMLYIHGTADEKVPWQGMAVKDSEGNQQSVTMSVLDSVKFWGARNRCGPNVSSKELLPAGKSPGTHVKIFSSNDCHENAQVVLFAVIGGGHNWPGKANFIPPEVAGRVNMDIHASDVIWDFFAATRPTP
ncbi:MAG: PHB depolymerase family esterase [Pseudomonadota bacterium]